VTIHDLRRILASCAGEDEAICLSGNILDLRFSDLGYDSLALMEIAASISHEYSVILTDDDVSEHTTARALLDRVNSLAAAA
jgi:acyl carrier protein